MTTMPKIALGAWAWGNDGTFGHHFTADDLRPIFDAAMDAGLNLWDTAFVYGMGTSEKMLGQFLATRPRDTYLVSDKFTPTTAPEETPEGVRTLMATELANLGLDHFDVYWVHNSWGAPRSTELLAQALEGSVNPPVIGVSNHNLSEIKEAAAILEAHGLRLGAVQNHYSLINRSSEDSGIINYCRENGIAFWSYMVLEQGALSGKYGSAHPMPAGSARAETYNPVLPQLDILNAALREVAEAHGVGVAQIPVAWAIAKGTLPIIGVTSVAQVEDAARAASITLSDAEVAHLEEVADSLNLDVVRMWEKKMD